MKPTSIPLWIPSEETKVRLGSIDASWEALERFIQTLQAGTSSSDPFRKVLSAIREATEADVVFLCNVQTGEVAGSVGALALSSGSYQEITRNLIADLPEGGVWNPSMSSRRGASVIAEPSSALILPPRNHRSSWLIVLAFNESHLFVKSNFSVARIIWQLHADQQRHDRLYDKLKETLFGVVRCLSAAIDAKDPYTCGHSERVARIAVRLGEEMGLNRGETSDLYLAGLLHDLGKIGIRDAVLCKTGPLTPDEYLHIQEHPVTGEKIIANVTRLAYLRPGVRGHHERYDGKGYPDGLKGESIPLMARILAVADSCDAMMSVRRYRAALSEATITEIFQDGAGTQWDPAIIKHFLSCRHELFGVIQRGLGKSLYDAVERAVDEIDSPSGPTAGKTRKMTSRSRNP